MSNLITINTIPLDKSKLLAMINSDKQLEAVKYIKDETGLGLKDCKDIVDNLKDNSEYYGGAENTIIEPTVKQRNIIVKNKDREYKGAHIIKNNPSSGIKKIALFACLVLLGIIIYYMIK